MPYLETLDDNISLRTFNLDIDDEELVWHRDEEDRTVIVLEGEGWYFQLDNQLPIELSKDTKLFIPKMVYHRVIKGNTPLLVKIIKE